ncbi:MAG: Do family serine endopeptidase [Thermoguttaceae bacterium]|jgi:serine protease Do|nr:Do family serine endopeptidase [Thermoguttaceae bacterium]
MFCDNQQRRPWWLITLSATAVASLALTAWPAGTRAQQPPNSAESDQPEAGNGEVSQSDLAGAENLSRAFRAAAKRVIPTVVTIRTVTKPRSMEQIERDSPRMNPFEGTPYEGLFDDLFEDGGPGLNMPRAIPRREGMGSGVIIDPAGLVLTNNHVIEDADEVLVELADGRELKASDIKIDPETDLAVFRIDAGGPLPAAVLGDSDALDIGDWVLAIGNPFELELTVSAGIISGKGRALAAGRRTSFLQTDAAINPGNSGGPLVNLRGEVVGINTAIASNTGVNQGVGFAIPSNLAKWVSAQLVERGSVERAYLGVGIAELDSKAAERLGVSRRAGVLVTEVYPETPAENAGFRPDDVIVAFAGQKVDNPRQLQALVERSPAGSKQNVSILRDGKATTLYVVMRSLPKEFGAVPAPSRRVPPRPENGHSNNDLGFSTAELTPALAKQLGAEDVQGVVVASVDPSGMAAAAGIREGMLILRVGKTPVRSVDEFEAAIENESLDKGILLLIRTARGNRFIALRRP